MGWFLWHTHVEPPRFIERSPVPRVEFQDGSAVIKMPNGNLVGMVGSYPDELSAYLRFQYLQGLQELAGNTILMTVAEESSGPVYKLYVLLKNDLLSQSARLAELEA